MAEFKVGDLRQRITIQRSTETPDTFGDTSVSWVDLASRWASITPLQGREAVNAQQIRSDLSHRIDLRYTDLKPTDRIKYVDAFTGATRYFNLGQVITVNERGRYMTCLATEVVGGAS